MLLNLFKKYIDKLNIKIEEFSILILIFIFKMHQINLI